MLSSSITANVYLDRLLLIDKNEIDFNLDGKKEKIYFYCTKVQGFNDFGQDPCYYVCENPITKKLEMIQFYVGQPEIHKQNFQIRYSDLDGDNVPEILYSYNFAMPEHHVEEPYMIKYDAKTGKAVSSNISYDYDFSIGFWDSEDFNNDGKYELWLGIYPSPADDNGAIRYFSLTGNKLVENKKHVGYTPMPYLDVDKDPENFGFILKYGIGAKNEINTFKGTFTKDLIMDGQSLRAGDMLVDNGDTLMETPQLP